MTTESTSAAWRQSPPAMTPPPSLWSAARANDVAELVRLLEGCTGKLIDERDHRGYSPLLLAAYAGHLEALDVLLARGADPDTADLFGNTALMGAAFKGYLAIVLRLLAAGADPTATNHGGLDARGFALTFSRPDVFAVFERAVSLA